MIAKNRGYSVVAKRYRALQQWNNWLSQFLGISVIEAEQKFLTKCLATHFGQQSVLIGVPSQHKLLKTSVITHQTLITAGMSYIRHSGTVESDLNELPVAAESMDLVLLPHTLEYVDNPHQLLNESCRIVKPEGHLVIVGFNPISMWGIKKIFTKSNDAPWNGHFIQSSTLKKWLGLASFELIKQDTLLYRPPLYSRNLYHKLKFLEWLGRKCYRHFGGIYVLVAKAKMMPLTPMRLRWQHHVSHAPASISSSTVRGFVIKNEE